RWALWTRRDGRERRSSQRLLAAARRQVVPAVSSTPPPLVSAWSLVPHLTGLHEGDGLVRAGELVGVAAAVVEHGAHVAAAVQRRLDALVVVVAECVEVERERAALGVGAVSPVLGDGGGDAAVGHATSPSSCCAASRASRRWRRILRRSKSPRPPHTPYSSGRSSAHWRHCSRTGHGGMPLSGRPLHTAFASVFRFPSSGNHRSGSPICAQRASRTHPAGISICISAYPPRAVVRGPASTRATASGRCRGAPDTGSVSAVWAGARRAALR